MIHKKSRAFKRARLFLFLALAFPLIQGCAAVGEGLGFKNLEVPPEFNQKVLLDVKSEYQMHQAPRSGYDVGDLQSFHTQQTLPETIEDSFKEMFGKVEFVNPEAQIEMEAPDVPAIFEVKILDLANDTYDGGPDYRAQITLAVAMKAPDGQIFWQQAFRGEGYTQADQQFSSGLGPQDAVIDAMRDALDQMQKAIVAAPEVRNQMKFYKPADEARKQTEVPL